MIFIIIILSFMIWALDNSDSTPGKNKNKYFNFSVQNGSGADAASYPSGTYGSFPRG